MSISEGSCTGSLRGLKDEPYGLGAGRIYCRSGEHGAWCNGPILGVALVTLNWKSVGAADELAPHLVPPFEGPGVKPWPKFSIISVTYRRLSIL